MNTQNRIYVTLSPRMRKALELCANLDGSNPASYAAALLSTALTREVEKSPALRERWLEMEREAVHKGSWDISNTTQQVQANKPDAAIRGWRLAGSRPDLYEYGVEEKADGKNSGYLKSKEAWSEGFGTLMQTFKANEYHNKRLCYSALVKAEEVEEWAGLWMRVDGSGRQQILAFDNMQDRPIKDTTDWQRYEVVLDVSQESIDIAFGILLHGPGQVWISDIQFSIVDSDIPTTTRETLSDQPVNLGFTA